MVSRKRRIVLGVASLFVAPGLGWPGLGWTGLSWTGLSWTGLSWTGRVALAEAPPAALGPLGPAVARAAGAFANLSVSVADEHGALRWIVWSDGESDGKTAENRAVRLALFAVKGRAATPAWSVSWPDAYAPTSRLLSQWQWGGNPVLAVTMQFGAEAEQVDLYGLDQDGLPVRLWEKLDAAVEWSMSGDQVVLIVYRKPVAVLVPACYTWRPQTSSLVPARCPR